MNRRHILLALGIVGVAYVLMRRAGNTPAASSNQTAAGSAATTLPSGDVLALDPLQWGD